MKIIHVGGSPRPEGNSTRIATAFLAKAETLGAATETFILNKLRFKGCQGCMLCKGKKTECSLKDDLTEVLNSFRTADIIVLSSPIYYGNVSSQLKAFIDRTFSFLNTDFSGRIPRGKQCVFIFTQANPSKLVFDDVFKNYKTFWNWFGIESHLIRGLGLMNPNDILSKPEIIKQAEQIAVQLVH